VHPGEVLEDRFEDGKIFEEEKEAVEKTRSDGSIHPGEVLNDRESEGVQMASEDEVDKLRSDIAQAEAHETERFDKLASRVEKLELDMQNETIHEKAAQQRVKKLEKKVESLEEGNHLDGRLEELENDFMELSNEIDARIENKMNERDGEVRDLQLEINELKDKVEDLPGAAIEPKNTVAVDNSEEVEELEKEVNEVKRQVTNVMQNMKELTELVKDQAQ